MVLESAMDDLSNGPAAKKSKSQRERLGCVTNVFCSLGQEVIRGKIQALAHNSGYPEEEK